MHKELQIRILAFTLALALVLPMGLSLSHALHDHESQVCHAKGENHFHTEAVDCDHQHFFIHAGNFSLFEYEECIKIGVKEVLSIGKKVKLKSSLLTIIYLRGPPMITVL